MSGSEKHSRHNYDPDMVDNEPDLKRPKIDNDRDIEVVDVDDDNNNNEHVHIETSLLSSTNHSTTSTNNNNSGSSNHRIDDHDREAQLLNNVASNIIENVGNRSSLSNPNRNNNNDDGEHSLKQSGVALDIAGPMTKTVLNNPDKESADSSKAHIEGKERNGNIHMNTEQQQPMEQVQTPHDYAELIDRHTIHNTDDSIPVELRDLRDTDHIHSIGVEDPDLNEEGLLNKRGRRTTALVGSEAWRQQRRISHKEVERRRRENINMAINALGVLLPVKETSKAAILSRSVEYIQKLKETENSNIEKWTLQKLLSEQNASQLTAANEKLQEDLANAYKEIRFLKNLLKKHNIPYESDEDTNVQQ